MRTGGGRRPPGGPPRVPRSPEFPPEAGRPGQIISLDDIWRTEALFSALATGGTVPPDDPAAVLLAAFLHDIDPSAPPAPAHPSAPVRPERRHRLLPWPVPVRALVTALAAAAAVVLVAVVQPPWPASGGGSAVRPLSAQLQPTLQVRAPGQRHSSPGNPPLTGPAALLPPPAAVNRPGRSTPTSSRAIPADSPSGPASAARADLPGGTAPASPAHAFAPGNGPPAATGPVHRLSVPVSSSPKRAPAWASGPRRPAPTAASPGRQHLHPGPAVRCRSCIRTRRGPLPGGLRKYCRRCDSRPG